MTTNPQTDETARALLWRHGLPEDIVDGALCLHAQELAARQRAALEHGPGADWDYATGRSLADLIDPTKGAAEPDDMDLTERDIDRMMAAGTPVQIVTAPPDTRVVNESTFASDVASAVGQNMTFAVSVPVPAPTEFELRGTAEIRAATLTEAADFLRDAHFRDGLSVQEIGTAIRHWADRERAAAASGSGRVADETQAETRARLRDIAGLLDSWATGINTHPDRIDWPRAARELAGTADDLRRIANEQPAVVSQPDGEA